MALKAPPGPPPPEIRERLAALRVLVLCGGPGAEREISLESGRQAHAALAAGGPRVSLHDVRGAEDLEGLRGDVAVLMLHGEFGEDGQAPRILGKKGIACTGPTPEACALALDKDAAKRRMAAAGLPVAPWGLWRPGTPVLEAWRASGRRWPVVVKPNARGSSVGMSLVRSGKNLEAAVAAAAGFDPEGVLIEAHVEGREFTAAVLDGQPLPLVEVMAGGAPFDYRLKYQVDGLAHECPARVDPSEAQAWTGMAAAAARALEARDFCRVDFIAGPRGPRLLEVNTAPGFTAHSLAPLAARAAGWSFGDLCWKLVEMADRRRPHGDQA